MNSTCRANRYTLAAHTALRIIDISHIILYCDCFKRTLFRTFSATDTCIDTSLTGNSTFVFVYTADKYTTGLRSFLPQFNDILRTSFHTSSTSSTFVLINLWQSCLRVNFDSTEVTSFFTITVTQATKCTSGFSTIQSRSDATTLNTIISIGARASLASSVTTNYGYFRFSLSSLFP